MKKLECCESFTMVACNGLFTLTKTDSGTVSDSDSKPNGHIVNISHCTDSDSDQYCLFLHRTGIFVCKGYVFTPVCHSVHRGGSASVHAGIHILPPGRHPPAQCMLGDTGNKRAVRILLECNLV